MKVLMVSTDRNICDEKSSVRSRMRQYAQRIDELHIVVLSLKSQVANKEKKHQIAENCWAYPTLSWSRWLYPFTAIRIGKEILSTLDLRHGTRDVLVTSQDPFEAGLVGLLIAGRHFPLEIQVHTDFLSPYFIHSTPLNYIRLFLARIVLPRADCIRTVSVRIAKSIEKRFPLKRGPSILPIAVEHSLSGKSLDEFRHDYPVILTIARLERERNVALAIETFEKIRVKYPHALLLIAGDGRERKRLEDRAGERVLFLGWRNDLADLYASAHVFVNTALYEGYGRTLIEAAYAGVPIVTTDVGIVGQILVSGEGAVVCSSGDSDCIASAVVHILDDLEFGRILSLHAREEVEKNTTSMEEYASSVVNLWRACKKI